MNKKIKHLIDAIDVEQNRDEAMAAARQIADMGTEAMDMVIEYATHVHGQEMDARRLRKTIRAAVFTLSEFFKRDRALLIRDINGTNALMFLCMLSTQGFKSAQNLLHTLGYPDSEIVAQRLLMMPRVEPVSNDKEISLSEAVEEIFISRFSQGEKGFKKDRYLLGKEGRHEFALFRTGKKIFAIRRKKSGVK